MHYLTSAGHVVWEPRKTATAKHADDVINGVTSLTCILSRSSFRRSKLAEKIRVQQKKMDDQKYKSDAFLKNAYPETFKAACRKDAFWIS